MHASPYQSLVSLLSNVLEAYTTAFFVFEPKTRQLRMVASQSLSRHLLESVSLPLEQSGILSQVHKVGQCIHLDKLQETTLSVSSTLPFYREGESHIKGIFAMPVGDNGGVLYVDTKYGWGFNDKQQKWIREIGAVMFRLMQRQECIDQAAGYAGILEFWKRLDEILFQDRHHMEVCRTLVTECAQFLEAEFAFLTLRMSDSNQYVIVTGTPNAPANLVEQSFLLKQGLAGRVFQTLKPISITKLNPHAHDHFLFTPAESLPHHGTLWILPAVMSAGHAIALVVLSQKVADWSAEQQHAVRSALHCLNLYFDRLSLQEELTQLRQFDPITELYNAPAFDEKMEDLLTRSMQNSRSFTVAMIQFEPWHTLLTGAPPKRVRQCQRELAMALLEEVPEDIVLAQITENRIGVLIPRLSFQESKPLIQALQERGKRVLGSAFRGMRVRAYSGIAGYPQDGTRTEELIPLTYRRLHELVHSQGQA